MGSVQSFEKHILLKVPLTDLFERNLWLCEQRLTKEMQECERLRDEMEALQKNQKDHHLLKEQLIVFQDENEE